MPSCSFCGKSRKQVKVLMGVPHAFICDGCVSRAHTVIAEHGPAAVTPMAAIQLVNAEAGTQRCSFCEKPRQQVAAMVSAGDTRVCGECLEFCDEIVSEVPPVPSPSGGG
jgi:ATP-dependent protease Clp ATPase subunit